MGKLTNTTAEVQASLNRAQLTTPVSTSRAITTAEVLTGALLLVDTTAAEVVLTLPALSELPVDGYRYKLDIAHAAGGNNVKLDCAGSDTFAYGNTYFNLGSHLFGFTVGGMGHASTPKWGIIRNLTCKASAHRDASWASTSFSTTTIIPWDAEGYNNQAEVLAYTAGAAARYTVLTTGTYKVNYTIDIDSTGGSTWYATAQVFKNGAALDNTQVRAGNYGNEDQSLALPSTYINLAAGDYLDLRIVHDDLTGNLIHSMFNIEIRL